MNEPSALTPLDYLRPLWRFKWLVLLLVVAASAATYGYYNRKPKVYETQTQLYVGASDLDTLLGAGTNLTQNERSLANQARLVTTPGVAARVAKVLRLPVAPEALLGTITVSPESTADFLTLTADAPTGKLAADIVNGFAQSYLAVRRENTQRAAQKALVDAQSQLAKLTGNNSAAAKTTRTALRSRIRLLESASVAPPQVGQQLSQADPPLVPISPRPKRNAIFAGALALMLGLIAAYLFDRSDTRLRRLEDVERLLGLPVLASIPRVRRAAPPMSDPVGTVLELREPYRTLRVNLELLRTSQGMRTIMVSSALPAEGKSTVVGNLALAYRDAGLRVAVIEGDLRRPTLAQLFGTPDGPGLAETLQSHSDLSEAVSRVNGVGPLDRGQIDLIAAGALPMNPSAVLNPDAFRNVRDRLLVDHDIVLIDSPPVLAVSDALAMATHADGVLIVVRTGISTEATMNRLRRTFEQLPAVHLVGAVVNAVSDELAVGYYEYEERPGAGRPLPSNDAPADTAKT